MKYSKYQLRLLDEVFADLRSGLDDVSDDAAPAVSIAARSAEIEPNTVAPVSEPKPVAQPADERPTVAANEASVASEAPVEAKASVEPEAKVGAGPVAAKPDAGDSGTGKAGLGARFARFAEGVKTRLSVGGLFGRNNTRNPAEEAEHQQAQRLPINRAELNENARQYFAGLSWNSPQNQNAKKYFSAVPWDQLAERAAPVTPETPAVDVVVGKAVEKAPEPEDLARFEGLDTDQPAQVFFSDLDWEPAVADSAAASAAPESQEIIQPIPVVALESPEPAPAETTRTQLGSIDGARPAGQFFAAMSWDVAVADSSELVQELIDFDLDPDAASTDESPESIGGALALIDDLIDDFDVEPIESRVPQFDASQLAGHYFTALRWDLVPGSNPAGQAATVEDIDAEEFSKLATATALNTAQRPAGTITQDSN